MNTTDAHLTANAEAAKLVRTRRRLAKEFTSLCRRIQTLDTRLGNNLVKCTPAARELILDQLNNQKTRMHEAAHEGAAPVTTITRLGTTTRQIQTTTTTA